MYTLHTECAPVNNKKWICLRPMLLVKIGVTSPALSVEKRRVLHWICMQRFKFSEWMCPGLREIDRTVVLSFLLMYNVSLALFQWVDNWFSIVLGEL